MARWEKDIETSIDSPGLIKVCVRRNRLDDGGRLYEARSTVDCQ